MNFSFIVELLIKLPFLTQRKDDRETTESKHYFKA